MKKFLFLGTVIGLAGLSALLADVKTDYNHHADFAQYHTYSWLKVDAGNPLWVDRIKRAVDSQLAAKGWMMTPAGGDVSVAAYGATKTQPTIQTFYDGLGGGWGWRGFGGEGLATTTVQNNEIGSLTVDLFDSRNKQLLWRGTATETLSDKPEKNEKKLDENVAKMFKDFPPKSKG
jgi:hypothetical protein